MRPLLWVLLGVLLYTTIVMALDARGRLPAPLQVSGPILTVHTKRGRDFLEWLASPRRAWRAWGNFGSGLAVVVMVLSFVGVLFSAFSAVTQPEAARIARPQDVLVIPGVNQFLPWAAAVDILAGLLVGLVVHEGGHGLLCRVEDIDIESMGVAFIALVPLGAFVKPDEASQERADRGARTRMFAAGVTNNFLVTVLAFGILFGVVASLVTVAPGVAVGGALPGSAADEAGLARGDVITGVDGHPIANESEFEAVLTDSDRTVRVERRRGDPVTVERRLIVTRAIVDAPVGTGTTVTAVAGEPVYTESGYREAITGRTVARVDTEAGTVRLPVGVYVSTVLADGPLAAAGADDRPMLIHSVAGEPTPTPEALAAVLADTEPGEPVEVVAYHGEGVDPWNGSRHVYRVTLGEHPDADYGFLGVGGLRSGVSGIVLDDFGIDAYPADRFHAILGGSGFGADPVSSFVTRTFTLLVLPFASVIEPSLGYNFAGFNGYVTGFYTVPGPLGAGVVFALANVLFWVGWVNINLGLFNCIPSYPLDGGHILRACVEATLARLPIDADALLATAITTTISVTMILSLLGLIFLPRLLT